MAGKTSSAVHNRYIAKAYDRINFTVPKGMKETIRAWAARQGQSVNGYIYRLILEDMKKTPGE